MMMSTAPPRSSITYHHTYHRDGRSRGRCRGGRHLRIIVVCFITLLFSIQTSMGTAQELSTNTNMSFSSIDMCSDSSYNMSTYGPDDIVEPCILYDIRDSIFGADSAAARDPQQTALDLELSLMNVPTISAMIAATTSTDTTTNSDGVATSESRSDNDDDNTSTSEITLVQITPSNCNNHRDGAVTAVKLLNANNDGNGTSIGYNRDKHNYIKFRLISIVGGNAKNIGSDAYSEIHSILLDSVLETINNAHYILGSCSSAAAADKPIALKHSKVVISQVGPPGFYMDVATNPYVFGIHVNSDTYPLPALQTLLFHLNSINEKTSNQQVRVVYRDKSEFFYSTCKSVIDVATSQGFDVTDIMYDPDGITEDEDNEDGIPNSQNIPFLEGLADRLCPPSIGYIEGQEQKLSPAIFACVKDGEADAILSKIRLNGCRPSLSWFTTATWAWANNNPDVIPYFQGGGQWHKNFAYSDQFFDTGQDVLDYGLEQFGYAGNYDHVVSYAIPNLIADYIGSFFRIDDYPDVDNAFLNNYEGLRRALINFNAHTIFGPIAFNEYQRNSGRGAAGMQWIEPRASISLANDNNSAEEGANKAATNEKEVVPEFVLACMSPLDQADAAIVIPSPSASLCAPGYYVNQSLIEIEPALLGNKCSSCPINTYMAVENEYMRCVACPIGSSTMDESGATYCVQESPNLIPTGLKVLGYLFVIVSWSLAIGYIIWMIIHREDSVVKIGQPEFLLFICVGAIMSTSAIIPLTLADTNVGEDSYAAASRSCQAIPFFYSLGWVLMYSSITAKSYRLTKVAAAASRFSRKKVTAKEMYKIIVAFMVLDLIVLIAWQVVDPLMYIRSEVTKSVDDDSGVVTIETVGQCASTSMWFFLGPIIGIHVCLMVITNVLLWQVKNMSDRYQEQKYVALASLYICELLLLGIPILIAVQGSAVARYTVIAGVIFLTDTGVLSLIFIPKIKFQNEGLPEGMSVVQSMNIRSSVQMKASRNLGKFSGAEISENKSSTDFTRHMSKNGSSGRLFGSMSFSAVDEISDKNVAENINSTTFDGVNEVEASSDKDVEQAIDGEK
jgi:hypothetical protein